MGSALMSALMWIDTHCHLDAWAEPQARRAELEQAHAVGVQTLVLPAISRHNWDTVRAIAHAHEGVCYTLGIHPLEVPQAHEDDVALLRTRLEQVLRQEGDPRLIGIGEIGLDAYAPDTDLRRQEWFLREQLKLAREFELPVLLHVRRAQDRVLAQLRRQPPPGGIAHAFNGSVQQAAAFTQLGLALGAGGAATYSGSKRIRQLIAELPLEHWVLETDAPDIAPSWVAPGHNAPHELARIAEVIAQLRGLDLHTLSQAMRHNTCRALGARFTRWLEQQKLEEQHG